MVNPSSGPGSNSNASGASRNLEDSDHAHDNKSSSLVRSGTESSSVFKQGYCMRPQHEIKKD